MGIVEEVKKVEAVVVKDASIIKQELEALFGKNDVDAFLTAAEGLLKTEAGKIVKTAVEAAKDALPNGKGAALHAIAEAFSSEALKQAGIDVGKQVLNLGIETALSAL